MTPDQAFGLLVALIIVYLFVWLIHSVEGCISESFFIEPVKCMIMLLIGYLFGCR
jgi:hypothetical protein